MPRPTEVVLAVDDDDVVVAQPLELDRSAGDELVGEDAALRPLTPYAISKVRVEDDVAALADSGFTPVFLRNATAFGFSPRLRADIVLNNLVGHAVLTGTVRVLSDGTPWRPLVHARDIGRAFAACLEAPRNAINCEAFNIGTETNNVTVSQIAEAVVEAVPDSTLLITGENGPDPRSYRVDFAKARKHLGYEARWTVAEGAAELYTEYLTNELTMAEFTQTFTRLARLESLRGAEILDSTMRRVSAAA